MQELNRQMMTLPELRELEEIIRFEGMTKHQMAMALRGVFHNGHAIVPYFDDQDMRDPLGQQQVGRIADDQHNVVISQHGGSSGYPYGM